MTTISRSEFSPHTPEQLYELVNDVDSYPKFIPNCSKTRILERFEGGYVAQVELKFSGFGQSFATRNTTHPYQKITMTLASGPFKRLNGAWTFDTIDDYGCQVTFELAYEFASRHFNRILGPLFGQFTDRMVHAFVNRAKVVYGAGRVDSD